MVAFFKLGNLTIDGKTYTSEEFAKLCVDEYAKKTPFEKQMDKIIDESVELLLKDHDEKLVESITKEIVDDQNKR